MSAITFILNIPYTLIGFLLAFLSFPKTVKVKTKPFHFVVNIKYWWWAVLWMRGARAATIGHVVLIGDRTQEFDYEHELVHVRQHERYPLIFPILYYWELLRKGYRQNKFEDEAYRLGGNRYVGK